MRISKKIYIAENEWKFIAIKYEPCTFASCWAQVDHHDRGGLGGERAVKIKVKITLTWNNA